MLLGMIGGAPSLVDVCLRPAVIVHFRLSIKSFGAEQCSFGRFSRARCATAAAFGVSESGIRRCADITEVSNL